MAATDISSAPNSAAATANGTKLRLGPLTALVIGSMVGSGVFSCRKTWPLAQVLLPL
jgi:arginine:ornithine antiporter/lysine permease